VKRSSFLVGSSLALAVTCAALACNTAATTASFTPITGIIIRSSNLVQGVGCGTAPDEVFKYVAFVAQAPTTDGGPASQVQYATVVDCFADGVLVNLSTASAQQFVVTILAFNEATWSAVGPSLDPAARDASGVPLQMLLSSFEPRANWVTTCTATEQQQIQVLAVCAPLAAQNVPVTEAGVADAPAPPDAAIDAPVDAHDAGADGAIDAPVDSPSDVAADVPNVTADAPDAD
jgi:hypothetical protein